MIIYIYIYVNIWKSIPEEWCHGHDETDKNPIERILYVLTFLLLVFGPTWLHFQFDSPYPCTISKRNNKEQVHKFSIRTNMINIIIIIIIHTLYYFIILIGLLNQ